MKHRIQFPVDMINAMRLLLRGSLGCLALAVFIFAGCATEPLSPRVVFANLAINGRPVHMMLDTGAASTLLYSAAAKRVGLEFTPPRRDITPGMFEVVAGMSEPVRVSVGTQTFTSPLPVFILPPSSRLPSAMMEDGVIGWPEVRDNILVFDAAHHTVRSVARLPKETDGWLKLKVLPRSTLLLETPLSDGKRGVILVDTGAPQGVQLSPARWRETRAAHPEEPLVAINHSTWSIGPFAAQAMWADEIKLGALTLTRVPVENMPPAEAAWLNKADPDAEVAGVIGLRALARVDLIVDGQNGLAYARPRPPARIANWSVAENVRVNCDYLFVRSGIADCGGGKFDSAIADYTRALEINPKNYDAYANRALARQIQGDFPGALTDYDKVIELNRRNSADAQLQRQTLLCRLGRSPGDFAASVAGWKDGWTKTLALFVADQLDETALLAAAEKNDAVPAPGPQCEAFYHIGMKRLCNGDNPGAKIFFQRGVATGLRQYVEYQFATAELARLNATAPR
ncbi:MAG: aspartyl protease family protein [Verrucomicrobiota bacterium]|jgi:tetratricopeptide (TPR) repeat protein